MIIDDQTSGMRNVELGRIDRDLGNIGTAMASIRQSKQELTALFRIVRDPNLQQRKMEFAIISQFKYLNRIEFNLGEQKKMLQDEKDSIFAIENEYDAIIDAAEDQAWAELADKESANIITLKDNAPIKPISVISPKNILNVGLYNHFKSSCAFKKR